MFTYNLPVRMGISYAPSSGQILGAYATVLIFDWEIQNGPMFVPIYFNRFASTLSYECGFMDAGGDVNFLNAASRLWSMDGLLYVDSITLTAVFPCTVNTGARANSAGIGTIGASLIYYPHHGASGNPFSVSVATSLNF